MLYEIDKSRGSVVPKRVFEDYGGTVTSDSWAAWNHVGKTHQRCHWHYMREIDNTFRYKNPGRQFHRFAKKLRRILYDSHKASVMSHKRRVRAKIRFEKRIEDLASTEYREKLHQAFQEITQERYNALYVSCNRQCQMSQ